MRSHHESVLSDGPSSRDSRRKREILPFDPRGRILREMAPSWRFSRYWRYTRREIDSELDSIGQVGRLVVEQALLSYSMTPQSRGANTKRMRFGCAPLPPHAHALDPHMEASGDLSFRFVSMPREAFRGRKVLT